MVSGWGADRSVKQVLSSDRKHKLQSKCSGQVAWGEDSTTWPWSQHRNPEIFLGSSQKSFYKLVSSQEIYYSEMVCVVGTCSPVVFAFVYSMLKQESSWFRQNNIVITKFTFVTHFALNHGTLQGALLGVKIPLAVCILKVSMDPEFWGWIIWQHGVWQKGWVPGWWIFSVCICLFKIK